MTVKKLTLQEIKDSYEIVGALEGSIILNDFDKIKKSHIARMEKLNARQIKALNRKDYDNYYKLNLDFHNVFLDLSGNNSLKNIVRPYKQRLYDFPRRGYIEEWELSNCKEHDQFIELIKKKDRLGAAEILRDVHWSFLVQEKHIRRVYPNADGFDSH